MTTSGDPRPVPATVAYALCRDVLFAFSDRMRSRDPEASARRRGPEAGENARRKQAGRQALASQAAAAATRLAELARQPMGNAGVDAALLGYLLAWLSGWGEALAEIRAELAELGRNLDGIDPRDRVAVCRAVIGGKNS